jgi:phosphoribosylamine---glycine ligase
MNILLLGSGGREHTFAWKLSQSPLCNELFIAPGNAGTARHGTNVPIGDTDFEALGKFCFDYSIDMVVVGPEIPLVEGVYDYFANHPQLSGIPVIGPSKTGAQLEGSKAFSKAFMKRHNIPTADYLEVTSANLYDGLEHISRQTPPIVLKADGLAAGKGVLICESIEDAQFELREMLSGKFGSASAKVVIEEFMQGIEFSVFVLSDGKNYHILPEAKDYKRIGEGDTGLNTGGMGAVSPVPFVTPELMRKVEERVIIPTIKGLQEENIPYIGFIYIGLMNEAGDEPRVVEYNCRMGDPETEAVLPRIQNDLLELLFATSKGELDQTTINIDPRAAVTVILASGGYPGVYEKGRVIYGWEDPGESVVFHAGTTRNEEGQVVTNGGRVMAITSLHENWQKAIQMSMTTAEQIQFEGKYFRKDIGKDLLAFGK